MLNHPSYFSQDFFSCVLPSYLLDSFYLFIYFYLSIYLFFDSAGTYVVSELSVVSLSGDVTASVSSPKTAGCDVTASLTVNVSTVRSDSERTEKKIILSYVRSRSSFVIYVFLHHFHL